ncbi:general transcription factor II-I repeat domain-containing protein 2-like, partial [Aphis craccivora]
MCIICKETIAVLKEYNIKRHYETKHKDKFKNLEGKERVEKFNFLKKNLNFQQNIFKKKCEQNVSTVRASYRVAQLIAKESKSFSDGEFVKKCMSHVIDEICPENKCLFEQVSLSRQTITRRIEDLGLNLFEQVQDKVKHFQYFSIALDESTDMVDTAQLLIFLRGVNANFEITEELRALESLSSTTTGEDIFKALLNTFKNLDLDFENLVSITTDGAKSMIGSKSGLIGRINSKMSELNLSPPIGIHCIVHQQALCGKVLDLKNVILRRVGRSNNDKSTSTKFGTRLAGIEEAKLAIQNGEVDDQGRVLITVVADGAWSKISKQRLKVCKVKRKLMFKPISRRVTKVNITADKDYGNCKENICEELDMDEDDYEKHKLEFMTNKIVKNSDEIKFIEKSTKFVLPKVGGHSAVMMKVLIVIKKIYSENHIDFGPKNAQYTSNRIQNDIIFSIHNVLKKKIYNTLKQSYISIIADDTSDVGHYEQLSIVIRHFNSMTNRPVETFLALKRMISVNADSIFQAITDVLKDQMKLEWSSVVSVCFDGAAT